MNTVQFSDSFTSFAMTSFGATLFILLLANTYLRQKMPFNYPKTEKLCSKILISKLFEGNRRISKYPLRLIWIETSLPAKVPVQSAVSVSKRRFKKAVDRNLLKRRMREAFRLKKNTLYQLLRTENKHLALMFIYQSNEVLPFAAVEKSMGFLLNILADELNINKPK